jgi:hypothetical protein
MVPRLLIAEKSFRFKISFKSKKPTIIEIFLFWFFFLFVNGVNLWITLTLAEANYAEAKVRDLFCDLILSQFSEQASNRNLG